MENRATLAMTRFIAKTKLSLTGKDWMVLTPSPPQTFSRRGTQGGISRSGGGARRKCRREGPLGYLPHRIYGGLQGRPWEISYSKEAISGPPQRRLTCVAQKSEGENSQLHKKVSSRVVT